MSKTNTSGGSMEIALWIIVICQVVQTLAEIHFAWVERKLMKGRD